MINEVIVLESLYRLNVDPSKSKNRKVPVYVAKLIFNEYRELAAAELEGPLALKERIDKLRINDNGKKMAGAANIFKYRLTSGDRILYTYSKYLDYMVDEHPNALVLLQFESHDKQGLDASNFNLNKRRGYTHVVDLANQLYEWDTDELSDEEIQDLFEMLDPSFYERSAKYIATEEMCADRNCNEWDVLLSDAQNNVKTKFEIQKGPMLVLGGAGSGKTVLAIHLLGDFDGSQAIYFTQSEELRNKTEKQFRSIYHVNEDKVKFSNINDFCLEILGIKHANFVQFDYFKNFLAQNAQCAKLAEDNGLSPFDIWTEIRGTIKGAMNADWSRTKTRKQSDYSYIDKLIRRGYLVRSSYDAKSFNLANDVPTSLSMLESDMSFLAGDSKEKAELKKIIDYFDSFDSTIDLLPLDVYKSLPSRLSLVDVSMRDDVYKICEQYQASLGNELFDDNDLARLTIGKIDSISDKFDFVVVDEVQDYTEMQLLLTFNLRNSRKIFLTGDAHQLINPTMFQESRVKDLFYHKADAGELDVQYLNANFRCQQGIVNIANEIAALRRATVGRKSAEGEEMQESPRHGTNPFRMQYNPQLMRDFYQVLCSYPRTAILVPDDATKNQLINIIGHEIIEKSKRSIIFSIPEIKGMEYRYVLCFNMFGTYKKVWDRIKDEIEDKDNTYHKAKLRYYFNLVYVATTRAQDNLCFIDRATSNVVEKSLSLIKISKFDREKLEINNLTDSLLEWIEAGQEYESQGKYLEAIENYEIGKAPKDCIYKCKAKMFYNEHNYAESFKYYFLANDNEGQLRALNNLKANSDCVIFSKAFSLDSKIAIKAFNNNIGQLVSNIFKDCTDDELDYVYDKLFETVDFRIDALC